MSDDARRRKVAVTLDPDLADAVEQEARRERSTPSAVIRRAVAERYAGQAPQEAA
jgi:predicted transcriptional regulator